MLAAYMEACNISVLFARLFPNGMYQATKLCSQEAHNEVRQSILVPPWEF